MSASNSTATDPCAFQAVSDFDQSLNISAVFIILAASILGTSIPLLSNRISILRRYPFFFIWGKHVGTGVLLALGLIHLLAPAFSELGNPCLPQAWISYQYAPLFALLAALAMHFLETIAHDWNAGKSTSPESADEHGHPNPEFADECGGSGHTHSVLLDSGAKTVAAYLLEFGLTLHSVIIGITVGVASKSVNDILIPALVFHQFFEGFALGARLAAVGFSLCTEALLTCIYSVSCPLGIAIGIGIARSYNPNSATANLIQGSFDSISAGIILYVGFVQMLASDFAKDYKNETKNPLKKVALWGGLYLGAGVMAFIGNYL